MRIGLALEELHRCDLAAAGVSVDWELIGQAAQGTRETDLLALARQRHPDSLRLVRWANAMLKSSAIQDRVR